VQVLTNALKQVWGFNLLQLHESDVETRSTTSEDRCTNPGESVPFVYFLHFLFALQFILPLSRGSHWGQYVIQV
jgi:hypothetical protein